MKTYTEKRDEKNVIPLRNAVCGIDMPHWNLSRANDLETFLYGDAVDALAAYESESVFQRIARGLPKHPCDSHISTDGTYILCDTEERANSIADLLDAMGWDSVTGYFDPAKDKRMGEEDRYTGWWYVSAD